MAEYHDHEACPNSAANGNGNDNGSHDNQHHDNTNGMDNEEQESMPIISITIDDAIDRMGYGKFQQRIMMAAGLCFAADALEILLLSFLSVILQAEWHLTDTQFSGIFASLFAGAFIGTLTLGRLADQYGRKPLFTLTASIIALFGISTAATQTYTQLCMARFLVGVGVGGITIPYDALAEVMPTAARGQGLVTTSYFWCGASLLVPCVAYLTLGDGHHDSDNDNDNKSHWRLFVMVLAIPCLLSALVGIYVVPESPRWLCQQQKPGSCDKALTIVRRAATLNGHDGLVVFPPGTRIQSPEYNNHHDNHQATMWDLLSPQWRKTTLTLWCLWGTYAFLYYGTVLAITLAFYNPDNHDNQQQPTKASSSSFDYTAMIVSSSAELAGVTLVRYTVDKWGRIWCLKTYFVLGGLFVLGLCLRSSSSTSTNNNNRLERIIWAFLARLFVYSGSNTVWIVTAELLPTRLRTTGHSCANAVARVGAFLAPFLVSPDKPPWRIGVSMLVASWLIWWCASQLPETFGQPLGSSMDNATSTAISNTNGHEPQANNEELATLGGPPAGRHQAVPTEEAFLDEEEPGVLLQMHSLQ